MVEGSSSRCQVAAEADSHEGNSIRINLAQVLGKINHWRYCSLPVRPEGHPLYSDHLTLARPLEDQHVISPIDSEFCHPEVQLFTSSVKAGMNDQSRPTGAVAVHQTQVAGEGGVLERNADRPDEAAGEVCCLNEAVMALLPGGHNPRIIGIDVQVESGVPVVVRGPQEGFLCADLMSTGQELLGSTLQPGGSSVPLAVPALSIAIFDAKSRVQTFVDVCASARCIADGPEELEVELLILKYRSRNIGAVHLISSCSNKRCDQQAQKYNLAEPESEKRMLKHRIVLREHGILLMVLKF